MSRRGFRDKYPPKQPNHSCHHVAHTYDSYVGELEKARYQHNEALLQSTLNTRHNLGKLSLHALLDAPPKPRYMLMADCVDFMEALDPDESRIRRFGHVISFYMKVAEEEVSTYTADQARAIAENYTAQYRIITEGGEAYIRNPQYRREI